MFFYKALVFLNYTLSCFAILLQEWELRWAACCTKSVNCALTNGHWLTLHSPYLRAAHTDIPSSLRNLSALLDLSREEWWPVLCLLKWNVELPLTWSSACMDEPCAPPAERDGTASTDLRAGTTKTLLQENRDSQRPSNKRLKSILGISQAGYYW